MLNYAVQSNIPLCFRILFFYLLLPFKLKRSLLMCFFNKLKCQYWKGNVTSKILDAFPFIKVDSLEYWNNIYRVEKRDTSILFVYPYGWVIKVSKVTDLQLAIYIRCCKKKKLENK